MMKKLISVFMIFIFMMSFVNAEFCSETDDGEDYYNKGTLEAGGEYTLVEGPNSGLADSSVVVYSETEATLTLASEVIEVVLGESYNLDIQGISLVIEITDISFYEPGSIENQITFTMTAVSEDVCGMSYDGMSSDNSNVLNEKYCSGDNSVEKLYTCPNGCEDGACIEGDCEVECRNIGSKSEGWYDSCSGDLIEYANCGGSQCTDTDGGKDYYVQGVVSSPENSYESDFCHVGVLTEYFCGDDTTQSEEFKCPYGCSDDFGACAKTFPEVNSITLTGRLVDQITGEGVADARLMSAYEFSPSAVETDSEGYFKFTIKTNFILTEGSEIGGSDRGGQWTFYKDCYDYASISVNKNYEGLDLALGKHVFDRETKYEDISGKDYVDMGNMEIYPSADISIESDIAASFDVHYKYKNLNGDNGPGQGGYSREHYLSSALPLDYDVYIRFEDSNGRSYESSTYRTPLEARCGTVYLSYFNGESEWSTSSSEEPTCKDSDGGKDVYEAGDAFSSDGYGYSDNCEFLNNPKHGILNEAICDGNNLRHVQIECPNDAPYCRFARCTDNPSLTCKDSDGGMDPEDRGTIKEARYPDGPTHTDYCEDLRTFQPLDRCDGPECGLREYYCPDEFRTTSYRDVKCPDGCVEGECMDYNEGCISGGYQCSADGIHVQKCDDEGGNWFDAEYCQYGCKGGECISGSTCGDDKCTAEDVKSCPEDCNVFENYLILKDISNYKFKYAEMYKEQDSNYGKIVQYSAVYSYKGMELKAGLIELSDNRLAEKAFSEEILEEGYSILRIGDDKVFLVDNERRIVWLNGAKILVVDTLRELGPSYYTSTKEEAIPVEELPTPPAITGNVVGQAIARTEVKVASNVRLEGIKVKLEESSIEYVIEEEEIEQMIIPKNIIRKYLSLYPSEFEPEPVCGDGVCDYGEKNSCSKDCKTPNECPVLSPISKDEKEKCIDNNGKWVVSEYVKGCSVSPYCVYADDGEEITEIEKLALIMKLETLGVKIMGLRNTAQGLAKYYHEIGEGNKVEAWENAAEDFSEIIDSIGEIERDIKDANLTDVKSIIKSFISQVKGKLKEIINNVLEGLTSE